MLTDEAIDALPAWTLVQAFHGVARRFGAAFAEVGLSSTQFGVLAQLAAHPGSSQGELARRVLVTAQSIGELVGSLEERGLVGRPPHPGRGRRRPVELTSAGREALERATPGVLAVNAPEALGLTADEAEELNRLLHLVRRATGPA